MGLLDRILRRIILVFGFAFGAKDIVQPGLESVTQGAWFVDPVRLLDPQTLAQLAAQGIVEPGSARADAQGQGLNADRFAQLFQLAEGPPDSATLRELFRRGHITAADFEYALRRQGIENRWHPGLVELEHERLGPADVANAIQQGFVPNPGILAKSPPTTAGKVPSEPPIHIDPVEEAAAAGIDKDRLTVLARLAGLPPGPQELLDMLRRGIIDEPDVIRGIAEGHTKTEWADAYLAMLERPLYASELATLVIKKWLTVEQAHARAKAAGISPANLDLLILGTGRPPGPAQLQTAFNRGLIDKAAFDRGIAESDVRTEWTDTLLGLRVRYPTTFALRQLVSSGAIPAAEAARILRLEGWEPALADKVSHAWADTAAHRVKELSEAQVALLYEARYLDADQATAMLRALGYPDNAVTYLLELADARRIKHFLDAAVGRLHTLYVSHKLGEPAAITELNALGLSRHAVDDLMALWKLERSANLPGITPAEITAAVHYNIIPRERGIELLTERGYTDHDARFKIDVRQHAAVAGEEL